LYVRARLGTADSGGGDAPADEASPIPLQRFGNSLCRYLNGPDGMERRSLTSRAE